jgi:hypothetical protein
MQPPRKESGPGAGRRVPKRAFLPISLVCVRQFMCMYAQRPAAGADYKSQKSLLTDEFLFLYCCRVGIFIMIGAISREEKLLTPIER